MAKSCAMCGNKAEISTSLELIPPHNYKGKVICENCFQRVSSKEGYQREQAIEKITLTTGDIKTPYRILDTIITVKAHQAGYFDSANPSTAFDGIKSELRTIAYDMEANAVIYCQFEYRVGAEQGMLSGYLGGKQFVEIFAYGTAVKLQKDKPPPVKGNEIN